MSQHQIGWAIGAGMLLLAFTSRGEDFSNKSVLIVGDSLSVGKTSFGGNLQKLIEEDETAKVTRVAIGGMSASSIQKKSAFLNAIDGKNYDVCFVLFGTNDAANISVGANADSVAKSFEKLLSLIKCDKTIGCGSQRFGSAAVKKYPGINEVAQKLNAAIAGYFDEFVSLFDITSLPEFKDSYRTSDGVHFTKNGYLFLSEAFYERL